MLFQDFWVLVYWLLIAALALRIILKRRSVSASLAWLLVIFIFPVLGILAYLVFGEIQLGRRRAERAAALRQPFLENLTAHLSAYAGPVPEDHAGQAIHQLMCEQNALGSLGYNDLQVFSDPDDIFAAWLRDIGQARHSIRITMYIWHPKGRVKEVTDALIAAHERGVRVEIMADHAGSWRFFLLSRSFRRMRQAGIEILPALPVSPGRSLFRRVDLRLHRKLLVVDHHIAYSGSMNMADPRHFNQGRQVGHWIDMMLRFNGAAAFGVSKVFSWDWEVETGDRRFPDARPELERSEQWLSIIPSGPGMPADLINQTMQVSIYRADHQITIATPYFVPSEAIYEALLHAAQRGVKVTILVPEKCDSRMAGWASRSYYEGLLAAGVNIRLFHRGLLHTKALVVDDRLAIVGSVNLDMRSLQLNFELSFALYTKASCAQVNALLEQYRQESVPVHYRDWRQRPRRHRFAERLMYFFSPLL